MVDDGWNYPGIPIDSNRFISPWSKVVNNFEATQAARGAEIQARAAQRRNSHSVELETAETVGGTSWKNRGGFQAWTTQILGISGDSSKKHGIDV